MFLVVVYITVYLMKKNNLRTMGYKSSSEKSSRKFVSEKDENFKDNLGGSSVPRGVSLMASDFGGGDNIN